MQAGYTSVQGNDVPKALTVLHDAQHSPYPCVDTPSAMPWADGVLASNEGHNAHTDDNVLVPKRSGRKAACSARLLFKQQRAKQPSGAYFQ